MFDFTVGKVAFGPNMTRVKIVSNGGERGGKMKKATNEIYALVDEEFIEKFNSNQSAFMKTTYYKFYCKFCELYHRQPLKENDFFKNMHRRRIQLYQLCCPYCGTIEIIPRDKKINGTGGYNYCPHCGRGSVRENLIKQSSRFMRINRINDLGLRELKKQYPDNKDWLLAYDVYQNEIIAMASVIETVFRECFEALIFITNFGIRNDYVKKAIAVYTKNDFMNVEKANDHFKKAFDINLKSEFDKNDWNNLIDIVNLRNMMVHNNGFVDKQFEKTPTYARVKNRVEGNLYRLEEEDIIKYSLSMLAGITIISQLYLNKFYLFRNTVISNYYLNNVLF